MSYFDLGWCIDTLEKRGVSLGPDHRPDAQRLAFGLVWNAMQTSEMRHYAQAVGALEGLLERDGLLSHRCNRMFSRFTETWVRAALLWLRGWLEQSDPAGHWWADYLVCHWYTTVLPDDLKKLYEWATFNGVDTNGRPPVRTLKARLIIQSVRARDEAFAALVEEYERVYSRAVPQTVPSSFD